MTVVVGVGIGTCCGDAAVGAASKPQYFAPSLPVLALLWQVAMLARRPLRWFSSSPPPPPIRSSCDVSGKRLLAFKGGLAFSPRRRPESFPVVLDPPVWWAVADSGTSVHGRVPARAARGDNRGDWRGDGNGDGGGEGDGEQSGADPRARGQRLVLLLLRVLLRLP